MIEPRCPYCNIQGLDKLAARNLGGFSLIYCGQCGAIYGVVPTPQPKTKSKEGPGSAPGPLTSDPKVDPYQKHEPGPPPPHQEKPPFTPEEALSFWDQPGGHGFYTRVISDDEATSTPGDEPPETKS